MQKVMLLAHHTSGSKRWLFVHAKVCSLLHLSGGLTSMLYCRFASSHALRTAKQHEGVLS